MCFHVIVVLKNPSQTYILDFQPTPGHSWNLVIRRTNRNWLLRQRQRVVSFILWRTINWLWMQIVKIVHWWVWLSVGTFLSILSSRFLTPFCWSNHLVMVKKRSMCFKLVVNQSLPVLQTLSLIWMAMQTKELTAKSAATPCLSSPGNFRLSTKRWVNQCFRLP